MPGEWCYVEFSTGDDAIWGVDVPEASPDEPDAILQDADGWAFVGAVLGVDPEHPYHVLWGVIQPHDLEDGIFYLQIGDEVVMLSGEGLPSDSPGSRVRVRQAWVELWPEGIPSSYADASRPPSPHIAPRPRWASVEPLDDVASLREVRMKQWFVEHPIVPRLVVCLSTDEIALGRCDDQEANVAFRAGSMRR